MVCVGGGGDVGGGFKEITFTWIFPGIKFHKMNSQSYLPLKKLLVCYFSFQ